MVNYNLISEHHHEKGWYYLRDNGELYKMKNDVSLPYAPVVDYKKFNRSSYFDKVEDSELVKIILKG